MLCAQVARAEDARRSQQEELEWLKEEARWLFGFFKPFCALIACWSPQAGTGVFAVHKWYIAPGDKGLCVPGESEQTFAVQCKPFKHFISFQQYCFFF